MEGLQQVVEGAEDGLEREAEAVEVSGGERVHARRRPVRGVPALQGHGLYAEPVEQPVVTVGDLRSDTVLDFPNLLSCAA